MATKSILGRITDAARQRAISWLFPGWSTPMITDERESKIQSLVVTARKYYAGIHDVRMSERQKAYLKQHSKADIQFTVNHCPTVVDAVIERMKVTGFKIIDAAKVLEPAQPALEQEPGDEGTPEEQIVELTAEQKLAAQLWLWWTQNRMDAVQMETHRKMVRDGESFVIIDWDEERSRPKYLLHPRFVDESIGGDGYGMWIDYPNNDPLREAIRAIKQWNVYDEKGLKTSYRVVYYPNQIQRFMQKPSGKWVPREDPDNGKAPVEEWNEDIGIPVAHFRNPERQTELKDIIPIQDMHNKTWLDLMAAADTTAFRMLGFLGWIPTTDGDAPKDDGSNLLEVLPGQNIATDKPKDEVDLKVIEPADLTPLLKLEERTVQRMATVSDTPLHRFQTTGQVARAETLKQQDAPLISKIEERQITGGNAWEDCMLVSIKMASEFGDGVELGDDDIEDVMISALWRPAEVRDDAMIAENAKAKQELKVPVEQLWREMGYSEDEIAEFKQSPEFKAMLAMREAAVLLGQGIGDQEGDSSDDDDEDDE
jgi:hypothetical protein